MKNANNTKKEKKLLQSNQIQTNPKLCRGQLSFLNLGWIY